MKKFQCPEPIYQDPRKGCTFRAETLADYAAHLEKCREFNRTQEGFRWKCQLLLPNGNICDAKMANLSTALPHFQSVHKLTDRSRQITIENALAHKEARISKLFYPLIQIRDRRK